MELSPIIERLAGVLDQEYVPVWLNQVEADSGRRTDLLSTQEREEVRRLRKENFDHQRATGERSARAIEDERLLARIREVHEANYCAYGYRRMWRYLARSSHATRPQLR